MAVHWPLPRGGTAAESNSTPPHLQQLKEIPRSWSKCSLIAATSSSQVEYTQISMKLLSPEVSHSRLPDYNKL